MVSSVAKDIVKLGGVRCGPIDPRSRRRKGSSRVAGQTGVTETEFTTVRLDQMPAGCHRDTGIKRTEPIQNGTLSMVPHRRWQPTAGFPSTILSQFFQHHTRLRLCEELSECGRPFLKATVGHADRTALANASEAPI